MVEITSRKDLEAWLEDKPADFAQVISARSALRALPYGFVKRMAIIRIDDFSLALFRASAVSWAARNFPSHDMSEAAYRAADNAADAGAYPSARASPAAAASADTIYTAANSAATVLTDAVADFAIFAAGLTASRAENAAAAAAAARPFFSSVQSIYAQNAARLASWANISHDCNWLETRIKEKGASRALAYKKLWRAGEPEGWNEVWVSVTQDLKGLNLGYDVWIEWFNRRIEGKRAAFDIPSDYRRTEDKAILARLADATDEEFWDKGAEYVNTTLQGWIDEARARVAPPPKSPPLTDLRPDPQDSRSPIFGDDESGQIAITRHAGADRLRTDPQAQTRHALARRVALALADALRGHNDAGYIAPIADSYVAALGERVEDADPSILVFEGDQLREAVARHRRAAPDDDLQPLPTAADRAATAFLSAHNMCVGSDPYLDDLDRTTRGPDAPLPAATPAEVTAVADGARADEILAEPTYAYMIGAAKVAPADYDPGDRHSRFLSGMAQNFARYGVELLSAYPDEAAWVALASGVGATVIFGPVAAVTGVAVVAGGVAGTVATAYHMARNMIANEEAYRKWLGASPAGAHNFDRLINFLKSLPVKSLKDE